MPPPSHNRSRVHIVFDERGEVAEYWLRGPVLEAEARLGLRALALAPTLEICRALLAGEAVPLSALDREAVKRFGLRSESRS